MRPLPNVELHTQMGIRGDASYGLSSRQILLVERETLDRFRLSPGDLRENMTTWGIRLSTLAPGTILSLGTALLRIIRPCSPCSRLDELRPGLQDDIRDCRGTLATVHQGGSVQVEDSLTIVHLAGHEQETT